MERGWPLLALALIVVSPALSDVSYDEAQRTIHVTGFSQETMGTLQDVLDADREGGWGVVSFDEGTSTFTLNAHLSIGADDGSSTWFRIGTTDRPHETLVIEGDLRVPHPKPLGHRQYEGRNMLLIGDSANPDITPTVRFVCEQNEEHGLMVDDGSFAVSHATVTAAAQDRQHMAKCEILSRDAIITHSTLSWIAGEMTYHFASMSSPFQHVVFEHGGIAICNGQHIAEDCVFRDLQTAVFDGGSLDATLVRCRFEGNNRNWLLQSSQQGIIAIDCEFGEEKDPGPHLRRGRIRDGPWQYPSFVAMRHVVVRVLDKDGQAVEGALVELVESLGELWAVHHGMAKTDAEGRTPAPDQRGALLVTDYVHKATDDVPEPESRECRIEEYDYRYDIRVTAEGYQTRIVQDIDPDQSWVERTVVLKRR